MEKTNNSEKRPLRGALSLAEIGALRRWASANGRCWKSELMRAWGNHVYGVRPFDDAADLHGLRNRLGPTWLKRFKLEGSNNG